MEDARSEKQIALYLTQMQEIKHRAAYIKTCMPGNIGRIEVENLALQVRKIIELVAFSQISIHLRKYKDRRSYIGDNYEEDWNARSIFNNVKRLNPDSYPIPINPAFQVKPDGTKHFELLDKSSYLSKSQLLKLYDRCGGLLHADNPWKEHGSKCDNFKKDLPEKLELLKNLLNYHAILVNHWEEGISTTLLIAMNSLDDLPICHIGHGDGCSYLSK